MTTSSAREQFVDERLDKAVSQSMVERCEDQRARVVQVSEATAVSRFTVHPHG